MTEIRPGRADDEKPQVLLDWQTHWCARHLEPFRAEWPRGAGIAMVRLFGAAVADERITSRAPKGADGKADARALQAILDEHGPLCCFISEEALQAIYDEALG